MKVKKKSIYDSYKRLNKKLVNTGRYGLENKTCVRDWGLIRNIVEIPVNDALRATPITEDETLSNLWKESIPIIRKALYLLREDGAVTILPKIGKVLSFRNSNPTEFDINPLSPTYLQPLTVSVPISDIEISDDFVYITLGGDEEYIEANMKGLSVVDIVKDSVVRYYDSLEESTAILNTLNQDVILMEGLHDKIDDDEDGLLQRLEVMARLKSNHSILLLDKDDEFVSINKSLSGAKDVVERNAIDVSSLAKIPYSRLFVKAGGGLNDNGSSEMAIYYDTVVASIQHIALEIFNRLTDRRETFKFTELYSKNKKEDSEVLAKNTESVLKLVEVELISEKEGKEILDLK